MPIKRPRTASKNPPILSHAFIIQNHADIVSCVAMVFVLGLLFQVTAPFATMFVVMGHNTSDLFSGTELPVQYIYGLKDIPLVFFYFLITIVMHAVIQEYVLDKLNRKLHLSKTKHSKFNESGQLLIFYLVSVAWGVEIIRRQHLVTSVSSLWADYPHKEMPYLFKFYFVIQVAYWLHAFPELYFQKVKREEIASRVTYSALYLIFFVAAYLFNFTRVAVVLSVLHYTVEALFHLSRLFYFADKSEVSDSGFRLWNILFVIVRLASITLSVLTFFYGLSLSSSQELNLAEGNFNTQIVRLNVLAGICLLQAWMMWNFINFHLKRKRERALELSKKNYTKNKFLALKEKKRNKKLEEDVSELPEVDQNTKITQRKSVKAK
ncbi:Translocating chain-associated membrane protein 1-like 1 [Halotydeus destructor]|nr:Translocating chain-associated membrane protein 1-like 1 [Halotydeus destructor]